MILRTINPVTEELIREYLPLTNLELEAMIAAGQLSQQNWKKESMAKRQALASALAGVLAQRKQSLARLMTDEMGKPLTAALSEIEKCMALCEHFAKESANYLQERVVKTEWQRASVCYEPLGLILGVMPWNFPCWQLLRFAIPALMAGNAVLVKPAEITTGSGLALADVFLAAGFPKHLFQIVPTTNEGVSFMLSHPLVKGLSLTGSRQAGVNLAAQAASQLKKVVLELGGNDPYLVLADANLKLAAEAIVTSRLSNCGQVCIAAKRVIAVKAIYEDLIAAIKEGLNSYIMDDPLLPGCKLGPMARADLRATLHAQVLATLEQGARCEAGAILPERKDFYYPPTLLLDVKAGMPAFDEELFGPVIAVIAAEDEEEAIALANQSPYGLGAAIFTQDEERAWQLARTCIEAGSCFVNLLVNSDPRLPFGGIKQSGFGRELSLEGILEFVNIKTVVLR